MLQNLESEPKTVGIKQTLKAVNEGTAKVVFLAEDAQRHIIEQVKKAADDSQVHIQYVNTMTELGKACHVEVKTATAALIKE